MTADNHVTNSGNIRTVQRGVRRTSALRAAIRPVVAAGLERLESRRLLSAAQTFVNDNWQIVTDTTPAGLSAGDTVQSGAPGDVNVGVHTYGSDAFQTVADGVNNVTSGGSVSLLKGVYTESNVVIDHPMSISGLSGTGGVKLQPAAADGHDDSAFNVSAQNGLIIASGNVSVDGVTLDGGAARNFRQGIITDFRNNVVYNNVSINNVVVKNAYRRGIQLYSSNALAAPKSTGNVINACTIDGVTLSEGILVFDSDATLTDNNVKNASSGIASNTLHGPANAPLIAASGNWVFGSNAGAVTGMNMAGLADGSTIGPFNKIDLTAGSNAPDTALVVQFPNGLVHVTQNEIFGSASDSGIFIFAATNPAKPVDVSGNSLSNQPTNQDFDGDSTGIFVTDDESFFGAASALASYVNITGNTFSGYTRGIDLFRGSASGSATIEATIDGNTSAGGKTHLRVFDADGAANGVQALAHIGTDTGAIAGDVTGLEVDGGSADIAARATYPASAAVKVLNGGSLTVSSGGGQLVAGPTTNDGTLTVNGRAQLGDLAGVGAVSVSAVNATLSSNFVRQNSLNLTDNARATINNSNGSGNVSIVKSLSIGANAQLDLANNDMIYDYTGASPRNTVRSLLQTGYGTSTWGGKGINSSSAGGAANHRPGIGFLETADTGMTEFDGVPVDSTALVLKYTIIADADTDAAVTLSDFTYLAAHFNQTNTYWLYGDFNYDGVTDLTDFTILATVFGATFAAPSTAPASDPAPVTTTNVPTRTATGPIAINPARKTDSLFASTEIGDRNVLGI